MPKTYPLANAHIERAASSVRSALAVVAPGTPLTNVLQEVLEKLALAAQVIDAEEIARAVGKQGHERPINLNDAPTAITAKDNWEI